MSQEQQIERYRELMIDFKHRLFAAQSLAESLEPGIATYDFEYVLLHIRRLLEIVAYSSLLANQGAFLEHFPKFEHEWRPKQLLDLLKRINPDFYPVPILKREKDHLITLKENFLTPDQLIFVHSTSHKFIHTWHPLEAFPESLNLWKAPIEWLALISNLMRFHVAHVSSSDSILIVELGSLEQTVRITTGRAERDI